MTTCVALESHIQPQENSLKDTGKVIADLVRAVRHIVGGVDMDGHYVDPVNVKDLTVRLSELEQALKSYDRVVIASRHEAKDDY